MAAKKGGLGKGLDSLLADHAYNNHLRLATPDSTVAKDHKEKYKKRNTRHHGKTFPGRTES